MQMHASALAGSFKLFLNGQPTGQEHWKCALFGDSEKIRTFWTLCLFSVRENLGSPLPQVSVTRPWRERDGPCRMYAKLVGKYPIFVGPAWRERDGSVTGVWPNTGSFAGTLVANLQFYFHIFRPKPFHMLTGISPSSPFFWYFRPKVA